MTRPIVPYFPLQVVCTSRLAGLLAGGPATEAMQDRLSCVLMRDHGLRRSQDHVGIASEFAVVLTVYEIDN